MARAMNKDEIKISEVLHNLDSFAAHGVTGSPVMAQAAAVIRHLRDRIDHLMGMHANDVAEINSLRDAIRERNAEDAQGPVL